MSFLSYNQEIMNTCFIKTIKHDFKDFEIIFLDDSKWKIHLKKPSRIISDALVEFLKGMAKPKVFTEKQDNLLDLNYLISQADKVGEVDE